MRFLTEEDTKFKDIEHYMNLKKRFNRPDINDWYEKIYRKAYSIGYVSEFFKKVKPTSFENAYDHYILSGFLDTGLPKEKRGRTKEELEQLAIEWKDRCGIDLPLVDFYDTLVLHAVIETCFGMMMEKEAQEAYKHFGFDVTETEGEEDSGLAVDFIARKGEQTILVQVKPVSFFLGSKPDLVSDRKLVWRKQKAGLEKYPSSMYAYMVYDKDGKWAKKDGKFNLIYGDLIDKDGLLKDEIYGMNYTFEEKLF